MRSTTDRPRPRPRVRSRDGLSIWKKLLEHRVQFVLGDADPGVPYLDRHIAAAAPAAQHDRRRRRYSGERC